MSVTRVNVLMGSLCFIISRNDSVLSGNTSCRCFVALTAGMTIS